MREIVSLVTNTVSYRLHFWNYSLHSVIELSPVSIKEHVGTVSYVGSYIGSHNVNSSLKTTVTYSAAILITNRYVSKYYFYL